MILRVKPLWRHWAETGCVALPPGRHPATHKLLVLELQMALSDAFGTQVEWSDRGDEVAAEPIDDAGLLALRAIARPQADRLAHVVHHARSPNVFLPCALREPVVGERVTIASARSLLVELRAVADLLGAGPGTRRDASARDDADPRAGARRAWVVLLSGLRTAEEHRLPVIFTEG